MNLPWWSYVIFFTAMAVPVYYLVTAEQAKHKYACPHCHAHFPVKWHQLRLHMDDSFWLRCPECGKKGWCIPVWWENMED